MSIFPEFLDMRFPPNIAYGSIGGPEYRTNVTVTAGGYEHRNVAFTYPRTRFNVAYGVRDTQDFEELVSFFHNCKGRAKSFRFKDWTDFIATKQHLGTANANETKFQLQKRYKTNLVDGRSVECQRIIKKPTPSTVKIYVNDNIASCGTDYVVDYSSGIISFSLPPVGSVYADFEFDIPARFDTDSLPVIIEGVGLYKINNIPIVEIQIR